MPVLGSCQMNWLAVRPLPPVLLVMSLAASTCTHAMFTVPPSLLVIRCRR
jgi:hypothetical protein